MNETDKICQLWYEFLKDYAEKQLFFLWDGEFFLYQKFS